ncbi:hypothetical protein PFLUV_G00135660 [Perca fluviatilis]|uniref:Uncharacterized protein n=1 Tax=Perca fluviatilis TaxID=8168 RepID=A0A6A5EXP3_PERFL|nr:hypothetical protein PFLUV_G00135660 [Perca fluviatilis]
MDIQQQNRPCLETIQEESEQKDKLEEGGGGEEEDFQIQEDVETKAVTTEDQNKEDEDNNALYRLLRPKPRSLSQDSFLQIQSTNNHQEEIENFSDSDWSIHGVDLRDKATPPQQTKLGKKKRSISSELRIKNICRKRTPTKLSVQKKISRKRKTGASLVEEPFPDWLVDLMVNIEEATTHQLVVE